MRDGAGGVKAGVVKIRRNSSTDNADSAEVFAIGEAHRC